MLKRIILFSLGLALTATLSHAIVNASSPGGNLSAPTGKDGQPEDPGFASMVKVRGGAAAYLGNGWFLTPRHVSPSLIVIDGKKLKREDVIDKTHAFKKADLQLIHLKEAPNLPVAEIATTAPTPGTEVIMIGAGITAVDHMTYWKVDQSTRPWTWTEVSDPKEANMAGVLGHNPRQWEMSWGTNRILGEGDQPIPGQALVTDFSGDPAQQTAYEAQATSQDSGGCFFMKTEDGWKLCGMIVTVGRLYPNQPGIYTTEGGERVIGSGLFGNLTVAINLALYRDEIMAIVNGDTH
ncbi:hypothetical protein [Ruficoccus sp. ZRK36]|uniref:hypothetical protein n=1 Tax=Ruficoccus sp. ZRK36 TaxID=2866311 RepID=UPI001C735F87|nr:hypothetical protein [Ruficoccus sp. ZRK36]QYY36582.1 hypothetical protein K0V07_03710 [Ruficoccus sp. ZRK36]